MGISQKWNKYVSVNISCMVGVLKKYCVGEFLTRLHGTGIHLIRYMENICETVEGKILRGL